MTESFEHEQFYINCLTPKKCSDFINNTYLLDSVSRNLVFQRYNKYVYSSWKREIEICKLKYDILEKCKNITK